MSDEAPRYTLLHSFDWGMTKPGGGWTFVVSGACYLAAIVLSVVMLRRIVHRLGAPKISLTIGLVCLVPMVGKAVESLDWQMTSLHDQETIHVPAVAVIASSFSAVLCAWLAVETWSRLKERSD